jgi:glycosyltransferase involved in cell wall biosynthesis
MNVSIVIPTVGRLSLAAMLSALAAGKPPSDSFEILVVDDRLDRPAPPAVPDVHGVRPTVLSGHGSGPAAARNVGWRAARHRWVVFLDDDVVPDPDWFDRLAVDLAAPPRVGGVQGRVRVPLPDGHRTTDWQRSTAGLAAGRWITADMAFRREALLVSGGFDERFPRAFREDAELAYRVRCAGWELVRGERTVTHPVRPEGPWISLRKQRGNADDALLRRMYGRRWRALLEVPSGRRPRHVAITAAGGAALLAAATAATVPRWRRTAAGAGAAAAAGWLAGTAEFAAARIRPGPRTPREIATMTITSVAIPPIASGHWLRGWWSSRGEKPLRFTPP